MTHPFDATEKEQPRSTWARRKEWVVVALLSATVGPAVALGMLEVGLQMQNYEPVYFDPHVNVDMLFRLDSKRLWRLEPGGPINPSGFRDRPFGPRQANVRRVLVSGDSFVMGPNVSPEEAFPRQLEALLGPGHEVYNLGVYGYGPDQSVRTLEEQLPILGADVVVATVFSANDFHDLAVNELMDVSPSGFPLWRATNSVTRATPKFRSLMVVRQALTGSALGKDVEEPLFRSFFADGWAPLVELNTVNRAVVELRMRAVAKQYKALARQHGARLLALVIPALAVSGIPKDLEQRGLTVEQGLLNDQVMQSIWRSEDVETVMLRDSLIAAGPPEQTWDLKDGHLSPLGYHVAAAALLPQVQTALTPPSHNSNPP